VPDPTEEKFELYRRYLAERFGDTEDVTRASFVEFLYDSPVETLEFTYRDAAGNLLGVGLCDACERSLSSVYFYFDPNASRRRGLGTFSSLWEIEFARLHQIPHYYLGYWIPGCSTMAYKANFRPHELLHPDGTWGETSGGPAVENLR
jgi:arginine-tRNA-protein transferase